MSSVQVVDDDATKSVWRDRADTALIVLAVGSLPLLALELDRESLPHSDRVFLDSVNVVVLVAFAADYAARLVSSSSKLRFVRQEWVGLLVVVAQGAALLPSLTAFGILRVLRGARAVRAAAVVVRMFAVGGSLARQGRAVLRRRAGSLAIGVAALTWLSSSVAFTLAEGPGDGTRVESFFDSLWWSLTTMATVGYGDIYPETGAGRLIAAVTMLVGISTFAVVTAKVAEALVRGDTTGPADGQ